MARVKKKPTSLQRKFIANKIKGMSDKQAALKAGYAEKTANNPSVIVKGEMMRELFNQAMQKAGLTPEKLAEKLTEGLEATKIHGTNDDFIEVKDYAVRHKYLETSLEQLGLKRDNAPQVQVNFIEMLKKERDAYIIE